MDVVAGLTFHAAMSAKMTPPRGIGWAIRRVRQQQKLTLQAIALEVDSDPGNISRIERGSQNAPEPLLRAIAAVLGLSMADLWQLAETSHMGTVGITAKAGKMTKRQREDLEKFADYLLSRPDDK